MQIDNFQSDGGVECQKRRKDLNDYVVLVKTTLDARRNTANPEAK